MCRYSTFILNDGKTGFIVPPKDSEALAEAIIKLLKDNELRKEMGKNAYKKRKKNFLGIKLLRKRLKFIKKRLEKNHANK